MQVNQPQIASASFEMDKEYFEECFREFFRSSHWFVRFKPFIAVTLILLSLIVLKYTQSFVVLGGLLLAIGSYELSQHFWTRLTWVDKRVKSHKHLASHKMEFKFTESGLEHNGPTASGRVSWAGVRDVRETEAGLVLVMGEGLSMYVPRRFIDPVEAATVMVALAKRGDLRAE